MENQPFPPAMLLLQKLPPLSEHGLHTWSRILGRALDGRPYFIDERELQRAIPTMNFLLPQALTQALQYLRDLLFSTDAENWCRLSKNISAPEVRGYPIAPRRRSVIELS